MKLTMTLSQEELCGNWHCGLTYGDRPFHIDSPDLWSLFLCVQRMLEHELKQSSAHPSQPEAEQWVNPQRVNVHTG